MDIILREDVAKLGNRGDMVKVKAGYARNFLLPQRLAVAATSGNKKVVEQEKGAAIRREAVEKSDAQKLAQMLTGVTIAVRRKAGEGDQLFGSVTAIDVADGLAAQAFTIDRRKIQLEDPIKHLGEFDVAVKLHKDVVAHVKVLVNKEE